MKQKAVISVHTETSVFEVTFTGKLVVENDGIGSYEYWGSVETDDGEDYLMLEDYDWNKKDFTEEENAEIKIWADDNFDLIEEKIIKEKNYVNWAEVYKKLK